MTRQQSAFALDAFVERHIREEAIQGELLVARIRIAVVLLLLLLQMFIYALTEEHALNLVLLGFELVGLGYALFVLVAVRAGLYRDRTPYTTTAADIALITLGIAAATTASGDPTNATKGLVPSVFFLAVIVSSLRLNDRVAIVAGILAAAGLLALLVPVVLLEPQRLQLGDYRDSAAAVVSPIRVGIIAVELLVAGAVLSMSLKYVRRVVRRSLHTVTFMFADLRGFSAYTERAGDAAAARLVKEYRDLVRDELRRFKGYELKTEGDSVLAEFSRAREAVRCGLAILEQSRERNQRASTPILVGIGIHSGEPVALGDDYIGSAVNVAARLGGAARAGELLASDVVYGLVRSADLPSAAERTELELKGIGDMRAYSYAPTQPATESGPLQPTA